MFAGGIVKPLAEFVLKLVKEGRGNIPFAGVVPCAALKKCSTTFFYSGWDFLLWPAQGTALQKDGNL